MKCPKCEYLGFEASERCRNCGYDFSLVGRPGDGARLTSAAAPPVSPTSARARPQPAQTLPLFGHTSAADDEPLVKWPRAPRPPLAVRRTPASRSRHARAPGAARLPVLEFPEMTAAAASAGRAGAPPAGVPQTSTGGRRLAASAIDHLLLLAVDLVVIYLTLRMSALTLSDMAAVPPGPMAAFLGLLKAAYFGVFTALGGQTIGKMAMGLRVVADEGSVLEPARVLQRTVVGAVSVITLGLAFVPAVLAPDGRALHDRVARTRVVDTGAR